MLTLKTTWSANWWRIFLITLCSLLLSVLRFDDIPVGSFEDDAHYIVLAESLSQGSGYRLINYPYAPSETAFPPGYPMLLVPFVTLFPQNFAVLRLVSLVFWMGTLVLFYYFLEGRLTSPYREGVTLLVAINPSLVGMSTTVMSESPFLFITVLSVLMLDKWRDRYDNGRSHWPQLIGSVLLLITAVFIRTVGITLPAALLLYLLHHLGRQYLKWLVGVITLLLLLLLLIPLASFNAGLGGAGPFSPLYYSHVTYVGQNMGELLNQWPQAINLSLLTVTDAIVPLFSLNRFATLVGDPLHTGLMGIVVILVLAGYMLSLRQGGILPLYTLLYGGLLYFWIVYTNELQLRLLLPLLPFFYLYFALASIQLISRAKEQTDRAHLLRNPLLNIVFAFLLLTSVIRNIHEWQRPVANRLVNLAASADWIKTNTPYDAVLMSPNAISEYLYYRRLVIPSPLSFEDIPDKDIQAYIERHNVDYIIVRPHLHEWDNFDKSLDQFSQNQLVPLLEAHPDRYSIIHRNGDHNLTVYAVVR